MWPKSQLKIPDQNLMSNQSPYNPYQQPGAYMPGSAANTNQGQYYSNQPQYQTDKYQSYGKPVTYVYDTKPQHNDC